jgi:membrane protease YdiL (CAAX protease family)
MLDLLLVIAVYVLASVLYVAASLAISNMLRRAGWLAGDTDPSPLVEQQSRIVGNAVVSLLIIAATIPLLRLRRGATMRDFGWSSRNLLSDVRIGLTGFVMLAPPVYALQGLLVYFWQPSKHPLMETFKEAPSTGFFVVLLVSAAVIAPVFEELIFRVLLQGFLEKAFSFRGEASELVLGKRWSHGDVPAEDNAIVPAEFANEDSALPSAALGDENPYSSPQYYGETAALPIENAMEHEQPELHGRAAWLPIAVSSLIFALLHYSHGPDWIPLILLAAGMGYLYQRTHRILPSLVVHASLNSLSMWGLWVSVFDAPPGP